MENRKTKTVMNAINLLLADDNRKDHIVFNKIVETTVFQINLIVIEDGEKLMTYLIENSNNLPDVLFLHHNMPCDNGPKCLSEIKAHPILKELPVIIYSDSLHNDVADMLYTNGAHYYIQKTSLVEFKKVVELVFTQIAENKFIRPTRNKFILHNMIL